LGCVDVFLRAGDDGTGEQAVISAVALEVALDVRFLREQFS
jgi:hypothetical protein